MSSLDPRPRVQFVQAYETTVTSLNGYNLALNDFRSPLGFHYSEGTRVVVMRAAVSRPGVAVRVDLEGFNAGNYRKFELWGGTPGEHEGGSPSKALLDVPDDVGFQIRQIHVFGVSTEPVRVRVWAGLVDNFVFSQYLERLNGDATKQRLNREWLEGTLRGADYFDSDYTPPRCES